MHLIDDLVFGVAAVDAGGHESIVSPYIAPPRETRGRQDAPADNAAPLRRAASGFDGFDEVRDDAEDAITRLDELDAGPVDHALLLDVADAAVRDAPLDDEGAVAEREPEVVKGIEVERKPGFDSARRRG